MGALMPKLPPEHIAPKYNAIIKDITATFHKKNREYWESKPIEERKCHYIEINDPWFDRLLEEEGFNNEGYY